jgi:hypothetical protein
MGAVFAQLNRKPAIRYLAPSIQPFVAPPYQKWISPVILVIVKIIAVQVWPYLASSHSTYTWHQVVHVSHAALYVWHPSFHLGRIWHQVIHV